MNNRGEVRIKAATRNLNFFITLCGLALLGSACATSSNHKDFAVPRSQRPDTLPLDVSNWRLIVGNALDGEPNTFVYPFYWEQGITSKITITWMPLPLGMRYNLYQDEKNQLSLRGEFLGSLYSRQKNFVWRPSLELIWKRKVTSRFSYRLATLAQLEVKRTSGNTGQSYAVETSLWYDAFSFLSVRPSAWLLFETGEAQARYLGKVPSVNLDDNANASMRFLVPLGLDWVFYLHPQWELELNFDLFFIGYEADYLGVPFYASVVYSW